MAYQSTPPDTLWRFYCRLIAPHGFGRAVKRALDRAGRGMLGINLAVAVVLGLNNKIGSAFHLGWLNFSPFFALVPLGLAVVYLLLDLSYQECQRIDQARAALEADIQALMVAGGDRLSVIRSAVARECGHIRLSSQDRYCLMVWTNAALTEPPAIYPKQQVGNSWTITYGTVNCITTANSERECQAIQEMHEKLVAPLRARALPANMLK